MATSRVDSRPPAPGYKETKSYGWPADSLISASATCKQHEACLVPERKRKERVGNLPAS